jgi:hypothetical protein
LWDSDKKDSLDIVREAYGTVDTPEGPLANESEVLELRKGAARLGFIG